jgi:hypothetical protein
VVARRSPATVICVLAGVMLLLGLTASRGRGAAEPASPALLLASGGTIELSNSLDGAAVFTAQNMRPGSSSAGTVSVSNTSAVDGAFSLSQAGLVDTPGPLGGRLSDRVRLNVEEVSGGGSTAQSLYYGVLAGLGTRPLGTLRAGQTRAYRFTVDWPDGGPAAAGAGDNLFQSAALRVDYVWTASGGETGGGGTGGGTGGTGGGIGGTGGSGPTALTLTLTGKRKQRPLRKHRFVVGARCSIACRLVPSARVRKVRGIRRLRAVRSPLGAGIPKRVVFKLKRKQERLLRRAFVRRKRIVAVVKVTATAPGAKVTATRRIVLKR